jgi:putative transposase
VDSDDLSNIRNSLQTGTPLGNDFFKQKVEAKLRCRVGHARRGRPDKLVLVGDGGDN